jgi:hypothetical protein
MSERPILFSTSMVRAILAGQKTQTRRTHLKKWAKAKPGDRLWVREAHYLTDDGHEQHAVYAEDFEAHLAHIADLERRHPSAAKVWEKHRKLRPSIHMPRWASRITLEVTDVRVEPLRDISEEDALAEGVTETEFYRIAERRVAAGAPQPAAYLAFIEIWASINGCASLLENPEVAVISFRRRTA